MHSEEVILQNPGYLNCSRLSLTSLSNSCTGKSCKQGFNIIQKIAGHRGKLGGGEVVLPREGHTHWLFSNKRSAQKIDMQMTLYRLKCYILGYIHTYNIYTCMHTIKIRGERGHEFWRREGRGKWVGLERVKGEM